MLVGKTLQRENIPWSRNWRQGGFGITLKATTIFEPVVIKTLNESLRQDPEFVKFQRSLSG